MVVASRGPVEPATLPVGDRSARLARPSAVVCVLALLLVCEAGSAQSNSSRANSSRANSPRRFDLTSATPPYDSERGYGLEASSATSSRFALKADAGNYKVTVTVGDPQTASAASISAETRRLLALDIHVDAGKYLTRSFIVNVRTPALLAPPPNAPGAVTVRLNPRETGSRTWDDRLSLEFLGAHSHVTALSVEPTAVPTLYLAGDSTVTDQPTEGAASWGQMLPCFFAPTLAVANHAESGETLKSFVTSSRLDKILETLHAGDWLMIQFGHNDEKSQWPQTYVATDTYKAYLRVYISEARRRGATPILVTSPERRNFDSNGRVVDSHGAYPDAVRTVAREDGIALIDLHSMSRSFYEALGPERAASAFADGGRDRTHHNEYGAYELAKAIVSGIRSLGATSAGLATHLSTVAGAFDPSHRDEHPNDRPFSMFPSDAS